MQAKLVEQVGRALLQTINAPRDSVRVMTFVMPDGERVLRVMVMPRYSALLSKIPSSMDGVRIISEVSDLKPPTLTLH